MTDRRGFLGGFFAAAIAASLYPVDFVLRHTRKLKATWTMSDAEMAYSETILFADPEYRQVIADHAQLISDDIDKQILRMVLDNEV